MKNRDSVGDEEIGGIITIVNTSDLWEKQQ
jgi:hypothetical protein